MSRYLYGFGNGASYCGGSKGNTVAPPLDPPNGYAVRIHAARIGTRHVCSPGTIGPYPTREEAAIVARHVMDQSWCVALVEGAN